MNKLVLIALVGCSLAVFMNAVVSEEPFETAVETAEKSSDFGAKAETFDATIDEDDLNDENAFDDEDEEDEEDADEEEDVNDPEG